MDPLLGADDVVEAGWLPAEAELIWFELGDPVEVVPVFSGLVPVEVEVPVADPAGRPLEFVSVAEEGPEARTLVLLGILDAGSEKKVGLPAEDVAVDEGDGSAS